MKLTKDNKGFTLIELLAVIVILAVIALIATPIILNIINDSKKSAAVDSAYGYIEAIETHIAMNQLDDDTYSIEGINLDGDNSVSAFNNIQVKGTKPSSGTVTLSSGRITKATLTINSYIVEYDGITAKVINNNYALYNPGDEVYFNPTTGEKCSSSEAVSTTGTKSGCMKWYVIVTDDSSSKSTVDVILDHNTEGSKMDWDDMTSTFQSYNWMTQPRAITTNEIAKIIGLENFNPSIDTELYYFSTLSNLSSTTCNYSDVSGCKYRWLYDRTSTTCTSSGCLNNADSAMTSYGYYTSDVATSFSSSSHWYIAYGGYITCNKRDYIGSEVGFRPVVTISKDLIK